VSVGGGFAAYADTARAFGCLRPDGTFDQGPKFYMNFPPVQVSCPDTDRSTDRRG
jgi:hypothetical protein